MPSLESVEAWSPIAVAAITAVPIIMTTIITSVVALRTVNKKLDASEERQRNFTDTTIKSLNGTASAIVHSFPGPCWIKLASADSQGNVEFIMHELNGKYEEEYGLKRIDYLGKTDLEAGWPKDVADQFKNHDLQVWATGESATFEEEINDKVVRFHKVRLEGPNGLVKGVMGYQLDDLGECD